MNFFLDTEFIESGSTKPITLISVGIVAEDGREYYAVSNKFKDEDCNDWIKKNVLPHLGDVPRKSLRDIACDLIDFVNRGVTLPDYAPPVFWGYYADYDWVVFCQLYGRMIDLPRGLPMWCHDIKQEMWRRGLKREDLPQQDEVEAHSALADAHWNRRALEFIMSLDMGLRPEPRKEHGGA